MLATPITEIDQLIQQVETYFPQGDTDLIRRAYAFSAKAHEGQTRQSGEPYLQHPLAVAGVLTFLKLDVPAIVAGLLHDTLEDTVATRSELEKHFGNDVARLVEGVTKIGKIPFKITRRETGGKFPENGSLHGGRYSSGLYQAGRPSPQHGNLRAFT